MFTASAIPLVRVPAPVVLMALFFGLALLELIVGAPGLAIQWVRERLAKKGST